MTVNQGRQPGRQPGRVRLVTPAPRLHDGLCVDDPAPWTIDTGMDARTLCRRCPVLDACRVYAAGHKWSGVVVAGWKAPPNLPLRPPWARR